MGIQKIHLLFINPSMLSNSELHIPASIAVVIPRHLSGLFLKSLRAWDYPNETVFGRPNTMLAGWLEHSSSILFFGKVHTEKNNVPEGDTPSGYIEEPSRVRVLLSAVQILRSSDRQIHQCGSDCEHRPGIYWLQYVRVLWK